MPENLYHGYVKTCEATITFDQVCDFILKKEDRKACN